LSYSSEAASSIPDIFFNIVVNFERIGERRSVYRGLVGKPGERDNLENPGIVGRIILRCIFRKWFVRIRTGSMLFRIGTGCGHL
jgi:hypothetical protein